MKSYILLRNNKESGPYTLQEMKEFGLAHSDLVWIEGESTSWKHPLEVKGLKMLPNEGIKKPLPGDFQKTVPLSNSSETVQSSTRLTDISFNNSSSGPLPVKHSEKPSDFYYKEIMSKRRRVSISTNFFGLGVLLTGVMLCAFVIKKMVDHFDYQPSPSAQAIEIQAETLPPSISSHAAMAIGPTENIAATNVVVISTTDSIVEKRIVVKKQESKSTSSFEQPLIASATTENKAEMVTKTNTEVTPTEVKENIGKKAEQEKETSISSRQKPSLQLSANEYKVGMFGGITNLELSVNNPSTLNIEKAIVEIEFLKPNGSVVNSQMMTVENISPGSSKKIAVPSSNRGVKVRYRVVSVGAQDS